MDLLPGLGTKLMAVVSAAVLMGTVAAPAHALQDTVVEHSTVSKDWRNSAMQVAEQQSADSMPDNPNAKLPDSVSEKISGDAMVVSEDLAVTPQGEVKDVQSGKTVKDKDLVGTQSQQPDPLAKTDGESFIPVSAQDVKEAVDQNKASQADNAQEQDSQSDDSRTDDATESEGTVKQSVEHTGSSAKNSAKVRTAGFGSNEYGAHWGTYDGNKAFFDYQNNLFAQQAKGVIDVSSWQGDINWAAAKADGVEGAIIRLGYGWGNAADSKAKRNISECKRLGIPFGIYWYSYAYDANTARQEGQDVAAKLRQLGVSQNDLAYPVFYDLERWTWTGHRPPTDPNVYSAMVNSWYSAMQSGGYTNLGVYSYTSYLQGPLNNANVYSKTRWVAQYGAKMGYTAFGTNDRGWQYTSSGHINGISGNVDMNAFGNKTSCAASTTVKRVPVYRVYNPNSGLHHYTLDRNEYCSLMKDGWRGEGKSFDSVSKGAEGAVPVYREYNPNDGNHNWTTNLNEHRNLIGHGWHDEKVAWYVYSSGSKSGTTVYRLYNPTKFRVGRNGKGNGGGEHVYTTSRAEYDKVGRAGWHKEGVAWHSES